MPSVNLTAPSLDRQLPKCSTCSQQPQLPLSHRNPWLAHSSAIRILLPLLAIPFHPRPVFFFFFQSYAQTLKTRPEGSVEDDSRARNGSTWVRRVWKSFLHLHSPDECHRHTVGGQVLGQDRMEHSECRVWLWSAERPEHQSQTHHPHCECANAHANVCVHLADQVSVRMLTVKPDL